MGWFDEQIRQRTESDQNMLEESLYGLAGVIMDKWTSDRVEDKRIIAGDALNEILKYLHIKSVKLPDGMLDMRNDLEKVLRPTGLMIREVVLDDDWLRFASGPMLGYLNDGQTAVALIPGAMSGYYYKDPSTGRKIRITQRNIGLFAREAICFYQPLPMKKLGIPDLLLFIKGTITGGDILCIVLASLFVVLIGMIEPQVYGILTGSALNTRNMNLIRGLAVFLISAAFTSQMANLIKTLLMDRIDTKASLKVESAVMMRILSLPVSFFREYSSGELSKRAQSVNSLCDIILSNIFSVGIGSLMSLLYIAQIFSFAPALVWPSILIILATVILSISASLLQIDISRRTMKLNAQETGMSYAILTGMQKIRLSGSEKRVFARWAGLYSKEAGLQYNPPAFIKINSVITTGISLFGTILLYYLALRTGVAGNDYYAFNAAFGRLNGAFLSLAGLAISVASLRPMLEMAEPILKAEPEVTAEKNTVEQLSGNIEINHVSFRYREDTPFILDDLNLKIRAGEYVAIVGRTGCGKSTLVRLLLGFEKPEKGSIYYDGHDLAGTDPRSVRNNIGVVIQNGDLFQGDIFSNIAISAPQLTLDEAWEAAEIAGIAEDIRSMPMGMNSFISEGQGGISGGQKQRLMIARAIAPKPRILIFDEATSALDNKTQKQVSDALDKLRCTRIIIAHRLSTIRNCDRILVLDNGGIIEEGTYDELIRQNGFFADLVERQRLDVG
ncbi:MAG: NHLP bacteriocin export ABC transporter permease/ATPase subunit [Lachnospiraceae bacterium]|nr:NHLP bacteriocin export ABC transporter permease/ATPase subunit [Lachnospiraceae bacterium]